MSVLMRSLVSRLSAFGRGSLRRAQLKTYDPDLAQLVSEVFGDRSWRYGCP
jgi:hypothetical protein